MQQLVAGEVEVAVLAVDGVVVPHLVQPARVQPRLDLGQPQPVLRGGHQLVNTVDDLLGLLPDREDELQLPRLAVRVLGQLLQ